jgi:Protein of unknown function (DUF3995)
MKFLAFLNFLIFLSIAILHFYWAAGGQKLLDAALPTTTGNKKLFMPGRFATLAVAAGLLMFAVISLGAMSVPGTFIKQRYLLYGNAFIGLVFFLRAVGDFRYSGFFKKIKNTPFANADTRYFTPLCVVISFVAFIIALKLYPAD